MLNIIKKTLIFILLTTVFTGITGCGKQSIISVSELNKISKDKTEDKAQSDNYEIIRLDNGTVVYKDIQERKVPSEYRDYSINPASSGIQFGPRDIRFSPRNVNPK